MEFAHIVLNVYPGSIFVRQVIEVDSQPSLREFHRLIIWSILLCQ